MEVFAGDGDLICYFQRLVGYSLLGVVLEHLIVLLWGAGSNGKTVLIRTLQWMLGTYAIHAEASTFLRRRDVSRPRNDLARLAPARIVTAEEPGRDRRLDEATVKGITGGGRQTARFLFGEHFEFEPKFTLFLSTNHRPSIRDSSDGTWRRVKLLPFKEQFLGDRADPHLAATLQAEGPGILAWAVRGCLAYQRHRLGTASAVTGATSEYRAAEDALGPFLLAACELDAHASVAGSVLFHAYKDFAERAGEKALGSRAFARELRDRGFGQKRTEKARLWLGVRLRADPLVERSPDA